MAAPTIVVGHTVVEDTGNSTSRNIAAPTHIEHDRIFVAVVFDVQGTRITMDGFETLYKDIEVNGAANFALFAKEAGASEPANYSIGTSSSERVAAIAWAVRGAGSVIHAYGANQVGTSATATVPAVTTHLADALRISIVATDATATTSPFGTASTHTKLSDAFATSGGGLTVQYKTVASASTDASQTISLNASDQWLGIAFAMVEETEAIATKAGLYVEIIQNRVIATKAGLYIELEEVVAGDWLSLWIG